MGIIVRKANNEDFFKTFREMQRDVDSVFDSFLSGKRERGMQFMVPKVDVYGSEKEYVFEFELPGFNKEDVKVNVENNVLTVSGQIKQEKSEDEKNYHVSERNYGAFKRQFTLPEDIDLEQISAKFENGILELKVQKKEEEKKQSLDIQID
jgi:HSP20 family protein